MKCCWMNPFLFARECLSGAPLRVCVSSVARLFCNAGRSNENFYGRVLIVLDLSTNETTRKGRQIRWMIDGLYLSQRVRGGTLIMMSRNSVLNLGWHIPSMSGEALGGSCAP